jgi:hypothetical protein
VFTRQRGGAASWGVVDELELPGDSPPSEPGSPDPGPGGTTPPTPTPEPLARSLSVSAREFSFSLSRPLVGTGTVTIELRNSGEDPHNLVVSPDDGSHAPLLAFPDLDPGAYLRKSVPLAPGRYALWCSLEFHEGLGMSATLRVE